MLLRIVEKENGEILVLYNDGRYGKASISTLREIFEGIETVEDMVEKPTDGNWITPRWRTIRGKQEPIAA